MKTGVQRSTTLQLIDMVGASRPALASEVVAAAEAELARRTESAEQAYRRRVRTAGTICAAIGSFLLVWGLLMSVFGYNFFSGRNASTSDRSFILRHFAPIYIGGALTEAAVGALLLVAGLGVRSFRPYGPLGVLAALAVGFVCLVLFTADWVVSLTTAPGAHLFNLAMAGAGVLNGVFWAVLLYLPFRYFSSSRLRETCNQSGGHEA